MKKHFLVILSTILLLFGLGCLDSNAKNINSESSVSGKIVGGYRVLPIQRTSREVHLVVYRGDYIKFDWAGWDNDPLLIIPELSVKKPVPANINQTPYFKMKTTGAFDFSLGEVKGDITVIEYRQANYREVTSQQGAELIKNINPLVLDVRTPREYSNGHLQKATLIPVQQLQARIKEIAAYKNQDILIYCATGNRSTVASKILIDNGFKRIINMRYGIADWHSRQYPVTR